MKPAVHHIITSSNVAGTSGQGASIVHIEESPPSPVNPPAMARDVPIRDWTREDLIAMLAHFEGELQARDIALAVLRSEQRKADNASNAQLFNSLQTDLSNLKVMDDSEVYVQVHSNHFKQINQLVGVQKECQKKFAERLLETEDQHARQLFELRDKLEETERFIDRTKQGLCAVLEERVKSLKNECARKQQELDRLDEDLRKRDKDFELERERQKTIVLFLLSERKQLLSMIHQMKLKMNDNPNDDQNSNIVGELKKQLRIVCEERNGFSRQCNSLQAEKTNLLNIIHNLEEDIMSLKANSFINKPTEISTGSYVVANKAAISSDPLSNNTGTVRFNSKKTLSYPAKSFDSSSTYQHNLVNGNMGSRPYTSGDGSSNLPRPSQAPQRSHPPAMGVRGSQLRNQRPTMGVSARQEDHRFSHPQQNNAYPSQFPTTAADMSSPTAYGQSRQQQIRMIPIDHKSQNSHIGDERLTKRSTSLPRKMNNETIVPVKTSNLPSSPTKIRPPSSVNHQAGAAPNFQPPRQQKIAHTHIS